MRTGFFLQFSKGHNSETKNGRTIIFLWERLFTDGRACNIPHVCFNKPHVCFMGHMQVYSAARDPDQTTTRITICLQNIIWKNLKKIKAKYHLKPLNLDMDSPYFKGKARVNVAEIDNGFSAENCVKVLFSHG